MNLLDEYKDLYYKELEYSERLNGRIATHITFLTITGGAQVILWEQIPEMIESNIFFLHLILCVASLLLFIAASIFFVKAFSGYEMRYFPIKNMAGAITQTYNHANSSDNNSTIEEADAHIESMMTERFINDAISNREQNKRKNTNHRRLVVLSCITLGVTFLAYATNIGIRIHKTDAETYDRSIYLKISMEEKTNDTEQPR